MNMFARKLHGYIVYFALLSYNHGIFQKFEFSFVIKVPSGGKKRKKIPTFLVAVSSHYPLAIWLHFDNSTLEFSWDTSGYLFLEG